MKKLTVLSTVLLTSMLSFGLTGCFSSPEPLPTVQPIPKPTRISPPSPTPEPSRDFTITDKDAEQMESSLTALGSYMGVDFNSMSTFAKNRPVYFYVSDTTDYVNVMYNTTDFPKEAFIDWMNSQNLSGDWVDFVPNDIEKIWGYTDQSVGKRSDTLGGFVYTPAANGKDGSITIWKE